MPNVMTAQPNIYGALCENDVIPFRVPRRRPLLECRAVTLPIQENARLGRKVNLAPGKIPPGGNSPQNVYIVLSAQETAKHRAKFGWPPLNDVAVVMSQHGKPVEICWGVPNSPTDLSR